jgi:sugar-specific transcriptional regulator TrmB
MIQKVKDILRLNDLTENEISVYIALLKARMSTIPQLREATGLPNITVYRAMQSLTERALVEVIALNRKQKCYKPLTLAALVKKVSSAQRRLRKLELELRRLDTLLPYLDERAPEDDVIVRSGLEAFREEYVKMPNVFRHDYLHIGNCEKFWETARLNYDAPEERYFINRRLERNIHGRVLDTYSPTTAMIQKRDSPEKRTLKIVPSLPITKDLLMIAEDQVTQFVCDIDNPRVIVMKNPELVALHQDQFRHLWAGAAS